MYKYNLTKIDKRLFCYGDLQFEEKFNCCGLFIAPVETAVHDDGDVSI